MSQRQALSKLAELHGEYYPILDALLAATPSTVAEIVDEEKRLAERIWTLAPVALVPKGATLKMLAPFETVEIDPVVEARLLAGDYLSYDHRLALLCCAVRSRRLGAMLKDVPAIAARDVMERAWEQWTRIMTERGPPTRHKGDTAAARYREIAAALSCPEDTVKKAVTRRKGGQSPK